MAVSTAVAVYFLIWWVILFAVLPWGVRSQEDAGEVARGTDPGAPAVPRLLHKLIWTTLAAAVIFAVFFALQASGLISLENLATGFGRFPLRDG